MATIQNAAFNDPNLGAAFSNIAGMFAPPDAADTANYALAKSRNQQNDIIAKLAADPRYAGFDQQAILADLFDPTQSYQKVAMDDATARRGQDITASTSISNNRATNLAGMFGPVSQDAIRPEVPASIAGMFGAPGALPQVDGARSPLTDSQARGEIIQGGPALTDAQTIALTMAPAKTTNVVDPTTNKPVVQYEPDAVGKQPAYAPSSVQSAYQQTTDKSNAETDIAIQKDAAGAQGTLNTVAAMRALMSDPNFYSGPAADQIQALKQVGATLGIAVPDNAASPMEAFNALSNQLIVDAAGGSLGNQISNGDVKFLQGSKPNLSNTQQGNSLLLDITSKLAKRKMDVAAWADEYKAGHNGQIDGGWTAFEKQKAEESPLFPPLTEDKATGAPQEGATATNPTTGQKAVFKGGQWVDAATGQPVQ